MGTYGNNFEFLKPPEARARDGRFCVPSLGSLIPIGAPVVVDLADPRNALDMQPVTLAPHGTGRGNGSRIGIAVYEFGPAAFAGDDAMLTTYSQKSAIPLGAAIQFIHGDSMVVVQLTNTTDHQMLGVGPLRHHRKMVSGIGATPTVTVGDYLVPGLGNDDDGYWEATADATAAWLEITAVDATRSQVAARMLF